MVKTILHARDPLFGGGVRYVQTGGGMGGMGKRPWVCTGRWGDRQETMGLYRQVGGLGKRP